MFNQSQSRTMTVSLTYFIAVTLFLILTAGGPVFASAALTDENIKTAVQRELAFDQAVPSSELTVTVTDGIVSLTGTIDNLLAKNRAVAVAETVKGVTAVINRIRVVPAVEKEDSVILSDVNAALKENPAIEPYQIQVSVLNGTATLNGMVDSHQEKQLAEIAAGSVSGVQQIVNNIYVQTVPRRSDSDIRGDILQGLMWDTRVDHELITVGVNDGAVRLSGTVGSAAEKRLARSHAWMSGVTRVDLSDLNVERWARDPELRKTKYLPKGDREIRDAVAAVLKQDPRTRRQEITAQVNDGVVTLKGSVGHLNARKAAEQNARHTVGVKKVKNHLRISPEKQVSDTELIRRIQTAFERDPLLEPLEMDVFVDAGTARLYGIVDSYAQKIRAHDLTADIPGVLTIENHITVVHPLRPFAFNPYVDSQTGDDLPWFSQVPVPTEKTDQQLRLDVIDQFWWSPFVDENAVSVTVDNGKVTLSGTVASWTEYYAAQENAVQAGASYVDNQLKISVPQKK